MAIAPGRATCIGPDGTISQAWPFVPGACVIRDFPGKRQPTTSVGLFDDSIAAREINKPFRSSGKGPFACPRAMAISSQQIEEAIKEAILP